MVINTLQYDARYTQRQPKLSSSIILFIIVIIKKVINILLRWKNLKNVEIIIFCMKTFNLKNLL